MLFNRINWSDSWPFEYFHVKYKERFTHIHLFIDSIFSSFSLICTLDQRMNFLLFFICIGNFTQQLSNCEPAYPSLLLCTNLIRFPGIWTLKLHLLNQQPGFFWSVVFLIQQDAWFIEDVCLVSWIHQLLVWIELSRSP